MRHFSCGVIVAPNRQLHEHKTSHIFMWHSKYQNFAHIYIKTGRATENRVFWGGQKNLLVFMFVAMIHRDRNGVESISSVNLIWWILWEGTTLIFVQRLKNCKICSRLDRNQLMQDPYSGLSLGSAMRQSRVWILPQVGSLPLLLLLKLYLCQLSALDRMLVGDWWLSQLWASVDISCCIKVDQVPASLLKANPRGLSPSTSGFCPGFNWRSLVSANSLALCIRRKQKQKLWLAKAKVKAKDIIGKSKSKSRMAMDIPKDRANVKFSACPGSTDRGTLWTTRNNRSEFPHPQDSVSNSIHIREEGEWASSSRRRFPEETRLVISRLRLRTKHPGKESSSGQFQEHYQYIPFWSLRPITIYIIIRIGVFFVHQLLLGDGIYQKSDWPRWRGPGGSRG